MRDATRRDATFRPFRSLAVSRVAWSNKVFVIYDGFMMISQKRRSHARNGLAFASYRLTANKSTSRAHTPRPVCTRASQSCAVSIYWASRKPRRRRRVEGITCSAVAWLTSAYVSRHQCTDHRRRPNPPRQVFEVVAKCALTNYIKTFRSVEKKSRLLAISVRSR